MFTFILCTISVLGGLVLLWFISQKTPKGTVLGIAVAIFVLSWMLVLGDSYVMHVVAYTLRGFGMLAGLLGLFDLNRPAEPAEEPDEKPTKQKKAKGRKASKRRGK